MKKEDDKAFTCAEFGWSHLGLNINNINWWEYYAPENEDKNNPILKIVFNNNVKRDFIGHRATEIFKIILMSESKLNK